jgi:hypothetical protein
MTGISLRAPKTARYNCAETSQLSIRRYRVAQMASSAQGAWEHFLFGSLECKTKWNDLATKRLASIVAADNEHRRQSEKRRRAANQNPRNVPGSAADQTMRAATNQQLRVLESLGVPDFVRVALTYKTAERLLTKYDRSSPTDEQLAELERCGIARAKATSRRIAAVLLVDKYRNVQGKVHGVEASSGAKNKSVHTPKNQMIAVAKSNTIKPRLGAATPRQRQMLSILGVSSQNVSKMKFDVAKRLLADSGTVPPTEMLLAEMRRRGISEKHARTSREAARLIFDDAALSEIRQKQNSRTR